MHALNYYRSSLSAETLKLKNTFSLWLALLAPCALLGMNVLVFWAKGEHFVREGVNSWHLFARQNFGLYTILLMPIFVALLTSLTSSIEHRSNGWKHLYSLPVPKSTVYVAKASTVLGLVLLSTAVFVVAYMAAGMFLHLVRPDLGFEEMREMGVVLFTCLKLYLATFVIVALQFWLSMRWSSFTLCMGVGIVAILTVAVAMRWEHIHYYPFAYPLMAVQRFPAGDEVFELFTEEVLLSLASGILVFVLGYFDIARKRIS